MYRAIHALVFVGVLLACLPHAGAVASGIVAIEATVATFVLLVLLKFEVRQQLLFSAALALCGFGALALGVSGAFGWPPIVFMMLGFALPLIVVGGAFVFAACTLGEIDLGEV